MTTRQLDKKIGFIGAGKMANAFIEGLLKAKVIDKNALSVSDVSEERIKFFNSLGINTFSDNKKLYNNSDIIILSVKPNIIEKVVNDLISIVNKNKLIISIAAGVTIETIEKILDKGIPIARVMPNTPALVGAAMSAYSINKYVKEKEKDTIEMILKSIGEVIYIDEKYLDAVTGLSGSGPAYVFMVINSLAEGGVKMGLSKKVALKLAAQTVLGSAKLVLETGKHPEELLDMVTSPGGTTIAGITTLEKKGIRAAFIEAVEEATKRSKELKEK